MKTPKQQTPGKPGRKAVYGENMAITVQVRMTARQAEKLARLGGVAWVRERIDRAKEKDPA